MCKKFLVMLVYSETWKFSIPALILQNLKFLQKPLKLNHVRVSGNLLNQINYIK